MSIKTIILIFFILFISHFGTSSSQPARPWLYVPKHNPASSESDVEVLWCPQKLDGSKCQSDDIFVYYQCCDEQSLGCCANNRIWVKIFLILMPIFFVWIALVCFWRKCFLQQKKNTDIIVDERLIESKKKPEFV